MPLPTNWVIGEALNNLSDEFVMAHPNLPISEAVDLRITLAHRHFDILRGTIVEDVPLLAKMLSTS